MADSARGSHSTPGMYFREKEVIASTTSLGITTLGVAGETQKGPAFQPTLVASWADFYNTFGSTNPEKFKGSKYPKYELPYIAKSYLSESNQLEVVRVLGLSGYNAGPAWVVTAKRGTKNNMVVAVLRARGTYYKYRKFSTETGSCNCPNDAYDSLVFDVGEISNTDGSLCNSRVKYNSKAVELRPYNPLYSSTYDCDDYSFRSKDGNFLISASNYGRFKIMGFTGVHEATDTYDILSAQNSTDLFQYAVSLNPNDKDYIINVLGDDPQNGDAPLYVESLYDLALEQAINSATDTATAINKELTFYQTYTPADFCGLKSVAGLMTVQEDALSRKYVGERFLADYDARKADQYKGDSTITAHPYDYETNKPLTISAATGDTYCIPLSEIVNSSDCNPATTLAKVKVMVGQIYTVAQHTTSGGTRNYFYRYYPMKAVKKYLDENSLTDSSTDTANYPDASYFDSVPIVDRLVYGGSGETKNDELVAASLGHCVAIKDDTFNSECQRYAHGFSNREVLVKNLSDGLYYRLNQSDVTLTNESLNDIVNLDVVPVECDLNNYKSPYRYSTTPWIVSNLMGDYNKMELKKLFRFHTISDGATSSKEIKISIENIRTDDGVFDVVVRDINDDDKYQTVLEKFTRCSLVQGSSNYIGYKIGSFDENYESKSNYIVVEINESNANETASPAGFLGYPQANYEGYPVLDVKQTGIKNPKLVYNLDYDVDTKNRKQYFGLSSVNGVDVDEFTYKGEAAYINTPESLTHGFHLDSRLNFDGYATDETPKVTVDGVEGYTFDAVSQNNRTSTLTDTPIIGNEEAMTGSIYENVNLRKFTLYFYGGFDGWDPYRDERTNTDDYKASKYLGTYDDNSGEGFSFDRIENPEEIGLNENGITSDYYAYLAGIRCFSNPEAVDINIFATPGIDYVNNQLLVKDTIEMIEDERADSIYVVTTPDKPSGADDYVEDMYDADDAVSNLEDSEIESNYTTTYYPWVKYEDTTNNQYIYLPATKDAVRDMASTDSTSYPWIAPAGISRGEVEAVRAKKVINLSDSDTLYDGRINPVKSFAADGIKLWGQKNLQVEESQLNRINVRRLLLRMKKLISQSCRGLIFESNDATTKNNLYSSIDTIMSNISKNRGVNDYKISITSSTEEIRDTREINAVVMVKPVTCTEYINVDFVVTPQNVSFDDI